MAETGDAAAGGGGRPAGSWFGPSLKKTQLELLQQLVAKHLTDPSLVDIASTEDFAITSTERGISRYQHSHLVAALDVLLMYQKDRRANKGLMSMKRSYRADPRTRFLELMKRWLRIHAVDSSLSEDEVKRMSSLVRDILNHPRLFPARNTRSFMRTLAEVFEHLQMQLRDVLEHDRTCAELAARVLSLSRNLVSDSLGYLLIAATDLKQTDQLPSLEVVVLWTSLDSGVNPVPSRADAKMQKAMKDAWKTLCGSLVAALLCTPWALRLFDTTSVDDQKAASTRVSAAIKDAPAPEPAAGATVDANAPPLSEEDSPADRVRRRIADVLAEFEKGNFKTSGLAGAFREPKAKAARECYLAAAECLLNLMYLLGEVLTQFARISEGLGDYGMIRVAPWLHPCLEAMMDKVSKLKACLDELQQSVDRELVLAKARGQKVKKPTPTERQSSRAHACIARAIAGPESHSQSLLQALEELKGRSAPERLPHVVDTMGNACLQLQDCLGSSQFRLVVGDQLFQDIPALGNMGAPTQRLPLIQGILDDCQEDSATDTGASSGGPLRHSQSTEGDSSDEDEERDAGAAWSPFAEPSPREVASGDQAGEGDAKAVVAAPPQPSARVGKEAEAEPMRAEVFKLVKTTAGNFKRLDRRSLLLADQYLHIFKPGSSNEVKTKVNVPNQLEASRLAAAGVLSLEVRRQRRGSMFRSAKEGETQAKTYLFEFEPAAVADTFQAEIARLRQSAWA